MPECQLIIFDCDGTLMDSEMIAAEVETELLKEYGATLDAREFNIRFAGTSSGHVQDVMEEELGRAFPEKHMENLKKAMLERLWREVKAMKGAQEMLDRLDQPRAIASNADSEKLKLELTRGELWDRFRPYVFSAQDHEFPGKPAPDLFLHVAREFDTEPAACAVLEDSVSGITAAKAAGMRAIGFTGGSHTWQGHADALTEAGAETVLNKLADVPEVISALGLWNPADF